MNILVPPPVPPPVSMPLPSPLENLFEELNSLYQNTRDSVGQIFASKIEESSAIETSVLFSLRESSEEDNEKQKQLEQDIDWLFQSVKALRSLKEELLSVDSVLRIIENEKVKALSNTHKLTEACAEMNQEQKGIEDFLCLVRQRVEVFDRLETLKAEIGPDSKTFIANMTIKAFQNVPTTTQIGEEASQSIGPAAPLYRIFTSIDDACCFFELHSDFLESGHYLCQFERLRSDLLLGIRQVLSETLEKFELQIQRLDASDSRLHFVPLYRCWTSFEEFICRYLRKIKIQRELHQVCLNYYFRTALDLMEGAYVATRLRLVIEPLKGQLKAILLRNNDDLDNMGGSCDLAIVFRQAATLVLSVASLELKTYQSYFVLRQPRDAINGLIGTMGRLFFDLLRPTILVSSSIQELRSVSECLALDILDVNLLPNSGCPAELSTDSAKNSASDLAPLYESFYKLHKDAQERLIFKIEGQLLTEVKGYEPADKDIDYPQILLSSPIPEQYFSVVSDTPLFPHLKFVDDKVEDHKIKIASHYPSNESTNQKTTSPIIAILTDHGSWYPSLIKLMESLSGMQPVIAPKAFQILAQHAVEGCLYSLLLASQRIEEKKKSTFDSILFSIKHLLMLREQIANLNCDLIVNETVFDFGVVRSRVWQFLKNTQRTEMQTESGGGLTLGNVIRYFMPHLHRNRIDTKRDLEIALKQNCETFVAHSAAFLLLPLLRLSSQIAEVSRTQRKKSNVPKASVTLTTLSNSIEEFRNIVISTVPRLVFNLQIYLQPNESYQFNQKITIPLREFPNLKDFDLSQHLQSNSPNLKRKGQSTPHVVLMEALRLPMIEAVRHLQKSILSFRFETENQEFIHVDLPTLKEIYHWWTPQELSLLIQIAIDPSIIQNEDLQS